MENPNETKLDETGLSRYLSPVAVWALSFGCAVGWGAFVMPGTAFLPIAGPIGTTIGMLIGSLVMLVIGWNYIAMMKKYPDAGGTFSYTKHLFGYDHGFFSAWFLALTYIAILWANATALALIVRNLFGSVFQFGFHYSVAGYDVWLGEILLSDAAIVLFGVLVIGGKRLAAYTQTLFAFLLLVGTILSLIYNFNDMAEIGALSKYITNNALCSPYVDMILEVTVQTIVDATSAIMIIEMIVAGVKVGTLERKMKKAEAMEGAS